MGALDGLRVVELGDTVPVAWCARQFAMWGAEVLVPDDSALPHEPPFSSGGESLLWRYVSAGKRSVDRSAVSVGAADIVVCERPDPSWPPHLVVVSITPFGLDGPYASLQSTELIVQALSGYLSVNGGDTPMRAPGNILSYAPGVTAFLGALAALRERDGNGGTGQLVEVSWQEAIASFVPSLRPQYTRRAMTRGGGPETGVRLMECRDGLISLNPLPSWRSLVDALLLCEVDVPADLEAPSSLADARDAIAPYVQLAFASQLEEALRTVDAGAAIFPRLVDVAGVLAHPQLESRGYFHGRHAGPAALLSETPAPPPQPLRPGVAWRDARPARATRSSSDAPPLDGVRIVDLTQAWIGPYASLLLADLGADVVKIESHRRPDVWRNWQRGRLPSVARPEAHHGNTNANFNSVNRNKRSLCLDLKTSVGRELLLRLVEQADVVMENYTAGTLDDLGVGWDVLRSVKPDIVLSSFSGYGATGPLAGLQANGVSIETVAGWDSLHGEPDGPPMHMGFYQADALSGLHMAALTLVALRHRDATGRGQRIDGSMLEAAAGYIGDELLLGETQRLGNGRRGYDVHGVFPCIDGWLAVTCRNEAEAGLFRSMPPGELTASEAMRMLQGVGIPAGEVLTMEQLLSDPHLVARGWFVEMTHPDMGTHLYAGFPWRFSRSRLVARTPSPRLGEHGAEVLRAELGLDTEEIAGLFDAGVTGMVLDAPPPVAPS